MLTLNELCALAEIVKAEISKVDTGGGCTAYRLQSPHDPDIFALITDCDGTAIPDIADLAMAGIYVEFPDGEQDTIETTTDLPFPDALEYVIKKFYPSAHRKWERTLRRNSNEF